MFPVSGRFQLLLRVKDCRQAECGRAPAVVPTPDLNAVDGCIPSDLGAGTTAEIEEERRLLYVAMTRAKDSLHIVVPQRFFTHGQHAQGDRHVYASRTRFIPASLLPHFECVTWPLATTEAGEQSGAKQVRVDVGARMRGMWR